MRCIHNGIGCSFYLSVYPRSIHDFYVLPGAIPALMQLKQLVVNEVSMARKNINSEENGKLGWVRSPLILLK